MASHGYESGRLNLPFVGISTFGKEGVENAKRANKYMRWRLIAQFVAVVLILVFVYFRRQGG